MSRLRCMPYRTHIRKHHIIFNVQRQRNVCLCIGCGIVCEISNIFTVGLEILFADSTLLVPLTYVSSVSRWMRHVNVGGLVNGFGFLLMLSQSEQVQKVVILRRKSALIKAD